MPPAAPAAATPGGYFIAFLYLTLGFFYAGVGLLLKGFQLYPAQGLTAFAASLLGHFVVAYGFVGRQRTSAKRKPGKKWTGATIAAQLTPVSLALCVLTGVVGASGVVGVSEMAGFNVYLSEPWQRQLVRYTVACVPAYASWSQFRQTLEGLCVPCGEETFPLEKDAPPPKPLGEKKED
eukprot:Rhum_TRINITY_DN10848_c0_g2::Rhum_TRINITY_DN10848_c0_g2_i1::g.40506::m.40506